MIATADFRRAIEQLRDEETRRIMRFRCDRALRNPRVMSRWYTRAMIVMEKDSPQLYGDAASGALDFDSFLDWLAEHWDEMLSILLSLLVFI